MKNGPLIEIRGRFIGKKKGEPCSIRIYTPEKDPTKLAYCCKTIGSSPTHYDLMVSGTDAPEAIRLALQMTAVQLGSLLTDDLTEAGEPRPHPSGTTWKLDLLDRSFVEMRRHYPGQEKGECMLVEIQPPQATCDSEDYTCSILYHDVHPVRVDIYGITPQQAISLALRGASARIARMVSDDLENGTGGTVVC